MAGRGGVAADRSVAQAGQAVAGWLAGNLRPHWRRRRDPAQAWLASVLTRLAEGLTTGSPSPLSAGGPGRQLSACDLEKKRRRGLPAWWRALSCGMGDGGRKY